MCKKWLQLSPAQIKISILSESMFTIRPGVHQDHVREGEEDKKLEHQELGCFGAGY